jgi:phage terminase small subunit
VSNIEGFDEGLRSDKQAAFVREYCVDFNASQAYIRAGYSAQDANVNSSLLMANHSVKAAIERRLDQIAAMADLDVTLIVKELVDVATADPRELVSVHHDSCRYCHGLEHKYLWTPAEYRAALDEALNEGKPAPDPAGGIGFNPTLKPHPECPECHGRGVETVIVTDTRKLSGKAAKLYAGAMKTKDGIKVLAREQTAAVDRLCRILGAYKDKTELSGPNSGPIQLQPVPAAADPHTLTNAQLEEILRQKGLQLPKGSIDGN